MANHDLPRRGSAAANGLVTLHAIGGTSTAARWAKVKSWKGTSEQFMSNVVERLRRSGLVAIAGESYTVTNAGRAYLGFAPMGDAAPSIPAGSPYVAPVRPLNLGRHFPARAIRREAFDYRLIPSVMAGERVVYAVPVSPANGTKTHTS